MNDARIGALFDAVPEAVVLVEFVDGEPIVRRVNDTFERQFGYSAGALRGESLNDHVVPDDDDRRREASEIDAAAADGRPVERELSRTTPDGVREFLFRSAPFEERGTTMSIGIYTDITDRRRERRRYEALIEHSSDVVTILDADGTVRYTSPSTRRLLGYAPDELVGDNAFDYVHPEDESTVVNEFKRTLAAPETHAQVEFRFRAADGAWRTMESVGTNYIDRPPVEGYVINSRDVTERKEREEQLRRQKERLDKFASTVSHDLRGPLAVASGRLALAKEECDSEHLDSVADALARMDSLIDDTLALARQGRVIDEPAAVALADAVEEAWGTVNTDDATLAYDDGLGTVRGDGDRIRELLENLFANAVEHGGGDATVRVGRNGDGFYVADDGPGVAGEAAEVFDHGYTTSEDGTGLGLAIVEEIAEAHGWAVTASESAGGGARLDVRGVAID